jgi:hypothetical protein
MLGFLFNTEGLAWIVSADSSVDSVLHDRIAYFVATHFVKGNVPSKLRAHGFPAYVALPHTSLRLPHTFDGFVCSQF